MTRPTSTIYPSESCAPGAEETSVHHKETTAYLALRSTYRDHRSRFEPEELSRTELLYSMIDASEGTERTRRLMDCRSSAWFSIHMATRHVHILSNACHLRWCPLCSKSRSLHIAEAVGAWCSRAKSPKFLTLTLRHTNAPLTHQINFLYQAFRQLKQRKIFVDKVLGGVWFFQIKWSKDSSQWHPHLHCLIDSGYIPQAELSDVWSRITNGSKVVDIRQVRTPKEAAEYVARYAARPTQLHMLDLDQGQEVMRAMHGRRICGTWGDARCVSLRPKTKFEDGEYFEVASWSVMQKHAPLSAYARAVFTAWQTHQPLAICWSIQHVDQPPEDLSQIERTVADRFNRRVLFEPHM